MKSISKSLTSMLIALAVMAVIVLGATSCRKGGINGDLDGQWQIMEVENLATGETTGQQRLYYCLYLHTVNLTGSGMTTGNMTYEGDRLTLEFPISTVDQLSRWYIYEKTTIFRVEALSGSHMVLVSDRVRISFRKY